MRYRRYILIFFLVPTILIMPLSIFIEILARNLPNVYRDKNLAILNDNKNYEVLILGSSHAYYGINPDLFSIPTLNAANVSQDLKYDSLIFEQAAEQLQNLKYVTLTFSIFTLFSSLDEGIESWRKYNYSHWFDFDITPLDIDLSNYSVFFASPSRLSLAKRGIQFALYKSIEPTWSEDGWGLNYNFSSTEESINSTGKTAAARHQKHTSEEKIATNISYLEKIALLCNKKKIKLLVVTTPAYNTYRSNLQSERLNRMNLLLVKIAQDSNNNIKYINLLADERFEINDFADADHLNHKGAKKLSKIIDNLIANWDSI